MNEHLSMIEVILGIIVTASSCGLIYTARDFYKMKDEIYKDMDKKYVSKTLHNSVITSIKEEIQIFVNNQDDSKNKVDRIYELLIRRQI